MDWWSVFRKIRKAIFIFIALTSLAWAGVLGFYLVREWSRFNILQRTIVISMISVNMITVIVQYLMIVLPFRVWRDFMRMLFLLIIHTATSVLYTLFGPNFSCKIFASVSCQDVDLAFLVASWTITGLFVGYTVYLCIMSRVPRPIPQITPNLLISSRPSSVASADSATHLLNNNRESPMRSRSSFATPRSIVSPEISPETRMVPQKLYVVNGDPNVESPDSATPTGRSVAPFLRPGGSYYGAMGTPRSVTASPAPTFSTQSTAMTSRTPMVPAATWDNRVGLRRSSRPEALPLPNPFMDPVSRPGTADTAYTALSFGSNSSSFGPRGNGLVKLTAGYNSSTSSFGPCGDAYMSGPDTVYLSPFQLSPEDDGGKTPRAPSSPGTESIYSLYDSPTDDEKELDLDVDLEKAMPVPATRAFNAPMVRQTLSSPPRMHTATPHSVHSVAPSVDWTSAEQRSQSPAQIQQQQVNRMPPPPSPVHARAASDPVYRPYTASPRLLHPQHAYPQQQPDSRDTTVLLPNPFPMVGATHTVRRYASIGHTRAQTSYYGVRNNVHLQAAMGRAPPRTQTYPVNVPGGKKSVSRAEWRQLVMNAASGR